MRYIFLFMTLLIFTLSCKRKEIPKSIDPLGPSSIESGDTISIPPTDKEIPKEEISYTIVCDTIDAYYLNTGNGDISVKKEIKCDTVY